MSMAAKLFVGFIFTVLGASFIATTAALYYEFGHQNPDGEWLALMMFYSHLFVFFPTLGIVALVAFYWPSVAFTDMYWRHVKFGGLRYAIGFLVLIGGSFLVTQQLGSGKLRSIWEVKPEVLLADQEETVTPCDKDRKTSCQRAPIMTALRSVRTESQRRVGMGRFVRECNPDPLLELDDAQTRQRYCFAMGAQANADRCCHAQRAFGEAMRTLHAEPDNQSLTEKVHKALLPFKIFFLLVVLVIALLLIGWRKTLPKHYASHIRKIHRGILFGAFAMLFMPLMNMAFLQSSGLLYGNEIDSFYRSASPFLLWVIGGWALMLLFFFYQEVGEKDMESFARIAGLVGSGVFALKYQTVVDYMTRYLGSGASQLGFIALGVLCVVMLALIIFQPKLNLPVMGKRGLTATEGEDMDQGDEIRRPRA